MHSPQALPDVGVTYIHRRPEWTDNIYGTGLTFTQGQTRLVPATIAESFLRHEDTFQRAKDTKATERAVKADKKEEAQDVMEEIHDDTAVQLAKGKAAREAERKEEHDIMDLKDTVARMDKQELANYAKVNFKQELNPKHALKDMRSQVVQFIDQFGVG